jgi:nucleotide-binding universal stress UspA family protein
MFERIAVALDGSACAEEAFAVALQLAQGEHATLGVCSIVDPIIIAGTAPPSPAMDLVLRDMESDARRLVTDAVEKAHHAGLPASGETRSGVPAFELLKYAQRFKADLIVMGTHGRRGLKHFLMGSVAEVVLREAPVPVLVVRSATHSPFEKRGTERAGAMPANAEDRTSS